LEILAFSSECTYAAIFLAKIFSKVLSNFADTEKVFTGDPPNSNLITILVPPPERLSFVCLLKKSVMFITCISLAKS
jgi:hypothetical protein